MGKGKGPTIGLKNTSLDSDPNPRFCNRIGCNGRIKYGTLNPRNGSSEKPTNPPFSSSNRNEMVASRSKASFLDSKRKVSLRLGLDPSGSGRSSKSEVSSSSKNLAKHRLALKNETSGEIKPRKGFHHKSDPNNQNTQLVFSAPSSSKSSSLSSLYNRSSPSPSPSPSSSSSSNITRTNSYSKNNSSISSSNSSSSGSISRFYSSSSSKNVMKNKNHGAKNPLPGRLSASISGSGSSSLASGVSKTATRRQVSASTSRPRLSSSHRNERIHSSTLNIGGPRSDASPPSSSSSSCSFSGANPENQPDLIPFTTDGIAEVLLAVERIDRDEEQVLALETDFYLDGLDFYDRHRDLRLDIDNMSYEELLALEERMGTVSTALSGEALSECIKTSIYEAGPPGARLVESRPEGDGLKCSICQEEYMAGEEIGQLVGCLHEYHERCIYQWLGLKNWCPICKASLKE